MRDASLRETMTDLGTVLCDDSVKGESAFALQDERLFAISQMANVHADSTCS